MARPKLNFTVLDPGSGRAQPGAWVSLYLANTLTLATLYADDDVSTLANPVQANQLGQVAMRVNPGVYDVSMTWDGAQPTIVEDVLAWTPEGAVLTTPGDLLVGGAAGSTALHVGQENQILVVDQGMPTWRSLGSNDGAPTAAAGSLLTYASTGLVTPILPGTQDQALAMMGGVPTWVSTLIPPGTTLPINQPGDLVVGAVTTGLPARLARGFAGDLLTVGTSGGLEWTPSAQVAGAVGRGRGDCYLWSNYPTDSQIHLYRQKGNSIWIDGASRIIPEAGVHLAATGLTPLTTYYIYAAMVGGVMVLEASTTASQEETGLTHKTGDITRTLVGMARPLDQGGTPYFINDEQHRLTLSYFNKSSSAGSGFFRAPRTTSAIASGGLAQEVHAEIRVEFLTWWDSALLAASGTIKLDGAAGVNAFLALDNEGVGSAYMENPGGVVPWEWENFYVPYSRVISEGYHWITIMYLQVGATATWSGDANGLQACRTHVILAGST
jgi:hypothetical protein